MAQDATIKLVLDTQAFLQQAKAVGPELQKALDVKGAISGVEHYQQALHKIVEDKELLNKEGRLKGAFDVKQLEQYETKFNDLFTKAEKWKQINEQLAKLGIEEGNEKAGLASLRGKIGSAVKQGGTGDAERNAYNEAKRLLEQKAALETVITTEYNKQKKSFDAMSSKVKGVVDFETQHKDAVFAINDKYAEIQETANQELTTTNEVADANKQVAAEQDTVIEKTKEDIAATKEDTAATEALADAKAKAGSQSTRAEAKADIEPSTEPAKSTEELAQGADIANQSLKELLTTLKGYESDLRDLQAAGQDTARVEQQIADASDEIKTRIERALNFDPATASLADLVEHYNELKRIDTDLQKAKAAKTFSTQFEAVRQEMTKTKEAIKDYEGRFKNISAGEAFEKLKSSVTKVTSSIRSGFNTASRVVTKAVGVMRSAVTGFIRIAKSGFNAISGAIKKVTSHFSGMSRDMKSNFKHMITSLTKYVLGFRSLFFLVRRLRKYIGEGIQNMAKFNNAVNPVNTNITRLLSSLLYLKNAWATAFSPILTFVTPWLEALIDSLARAGNAFSRFLGSLLGTGKVFQAVKVDAKNYGESLDSAAGSAGSAAKKQKELNDRLAAFDDLNVLGVDKDPNTTGAGGGGGAGDIYEPDPNEMFKIVDVGQEMLEKFKSMWEMADFSDLGKTISDNLVSALTNIQWSNVQDAAYKIGKSIATFLSGAFSDKALWESVGRSMAEGFNTLTQLIAGLLENNDVDWGGGLATLVNSLLANTDWDTIKSNLVIFGQQLKDNINSFLSTLSPEDIQKGATALSEGITSIIVTAITDIHWNEVLGFLGTIGSALVDGILQGLVQSDNPFISAVGNLLISIKEAFEQGDAAVVADGITTFFQNVFGNIDIDTLIETAKEFFSRLLSNVFDSFTADEGSVVGELLTSFKMIGDTLVSIFSGVLSILPELLPGILLITQASMEFINALWPLIETLLPPLNDLVAQITSLIGSLLVPVLELLTPVITLIAGILDAINPIIEMIVGFIKDTTAPLTKLLEPLMQLIQVILTPLQTLLEPIMKIVQIILDLMVDLLAPIVDLIAPLIEILVDCLTPIFDEMSLIGDFIDVILVPAFKLFADIIRLIVIPILKAMIAGIEFLSSVFKSLSERFQFVIGIFRAGFNELRKLVVDGSNFIASKIESLVNGLIGGINKMIRGLNKVSIDIPDWIPEIGGNKFGFQLKELSTVSIPRLAQGAVIPPNKEFMAVLGDQSHGTNIEAPLDVIKQAVAEVLANNGNAEVIQLLQQLIAVVESKNLTIGDKEIGKANARYVSQQQVIRGSGW